MEYRHWVGRLGLVSNDIFSAIDRFERDIDILRDQNEHVVENFRGKGKRPQDWVYKTEDGSIADASSTVETRIGGRLDWVKLGAAAQRLLPKLHQLDPVVRTFTIPTAQAKRRR